jgi:hypothetical protein
MPHVTTFKLSGACLKKFALEDAFRQVIGTAGAESIAGPFHNTGRMLVREMVFL